MTPELADKIMTRIIARVEADGGVLHKSSGIEEIIGMCAVADAEGEVIDVISYDEAKGKWVFRDGTPIEPAEQAKLPEPPTQKDFKMWQQDMWNAEMRARNSLNSSFLGQLVNAGAQKINR